MSKEQKHCEHCGSFETKPEDECNKCKGSFGTLTPGEGEISDAFEYYKINPDIASKETIFSITANFPTVYLRKDEYEYIVGQIATFMPEKYKDKAIVKMPIANCIYTFENHGIGSYRIIGIDFLE